jgi:hypothetical protein
LDFYSIQLYWSTVPEGHAKQLHSSSKLHFNKTAHKFYY